MTDFVVTPPAVNGILVCSGYGQFPTRRVYHVGRSYAAHARGMGSDPDHEPSFFFCKPADAVCCVADDETGQFIYPAEIKDCHYEIEFVIVIGTGGRDIVVETAAHHVYGYAIGLDMTCHDLQNAARKNDHPWETGETFDGSAPIGPTIPAEDAVHPDKGAVALSVGGREHQRGDLSDLIWSVPETVAYLSRLFELRPGDLIYTDTPEGAGSVAVGDLVIDKIDSVGELRVKVI